MNLETFVSNEKLLAEYKVWIHSNIGVIVCGVLQEQFTRPVLPSNIREPVNEHTASFCLGENAGAWKMFDALRRLDKFVSDRSEHVDEVYYQPTGDGVPAVM